ASNRAMAARSIIFILGGLALLGGAGIGGYAMLGGSTHKSEQETLEVFTVAKTSFDIATTSSGELEAKKQIEIRSKLESQCNIVEIVPEGTSVKAGTVLVRLNSDQLQTKIQQESVDVESAKSDAEAALTAHQIQEKDNESKLDAAQVKLTLAELSLSQWL